MKYLVLDLETTTKSMHGRLGNPWYNDIIVIGLKYQGETQARHLLGNKLQGSLETIDIIVGHNLTYDLLYLWKYKEFQRWLANGGKIFDTQLAEYMLSGQRHKYPALRDIAVNKYGCYEREKVMEKYWEQGIDTSEIPIEKVIFDVENDVMDTEQVMLHQVKIAKEEGLFDLIMERMEGLLGTIDMEYNGMTMDKEVFNTNKEKVAQELQELYTKGYEIARKYWDKADLNLNSSGQLSTVFFGGIIKELRYVPIVNEFGIEQLYKTGYRKGEIKTKRTEVQVHIKGFGLKPLDEWKTGKAGIYSTDEKTLKTISSKKGHEASTLAKIMLDIRNREKLIGTYYTGFEKYIYKDGSIRCNFNSCATDTGRLSSSKPNFQNLPR